MTPLAAWLFAVMVHLSPPARMASLPQWPGHEETEVERRSRYVAVAIDLDEVVRGAPPVPGYDRKRTAALLLGIAFMESGFARDVDEGPCYRGKGAERRCDDGKSACMMQVMVGAAGGRTREGWTQADLFADRTKCFRAGLEVARRSFLACAKHGPEAALNVYAEGNCESLTALAAGRARLAMAGRVRALGDALEPRPAAPTSPITGLSSPPPGTRAAGPLGAP